MTVSCPQNVCLFHVHKMYVCFKSTRKFVCFMSTKCMSVSCPQNVCLFHVHKKVNILVLSVSYPYKYIYIKNVISCLFHVHKMYVCFMSTKCMSVSCPQESKYPGFVCFISLQVYLHTKCNILFVSCPQNVCLFHVHKMYVCFMSTKCMSVSCPQESMSVSCPQNVCL